MRLAHPPRRLTRVSVSRTAGPCWVVRDKSGCYGREHLLSSGPVAPMARSLALSAAKVTLVAAIMPWAYAAGLITLVPLSALYDCRCLTVLLMLLVALVRPQRLGCSARALPWGLVTVRSADSCAVCGHARTMPSARADGRAGHGRSLGWYLAGARRERSPWQRMGLALGVRGGYPHACARRHIPRALAGASAGPGVVLPRPPTVLVGNRRNHACVATA